MHFILVIALWLSSLSTGLVHAQAGAAALATAPLMARSFKYKDGGSANYYSFLVGGQAEPRTLIFFYGGSGCRSWKSVMPEYPAGLTVSARIVALDKRFVSPQRRRGEAVCSKAFHLKNNPDQWLSDYLEFIRVQVDAAHPHPMNVVLVGVSEGALVAVRVARVMPEITQLAIIGDGAWSMRKSLRKLYQNGALPFDVDLDWKRIAARPRSLNSYWLGSPYRWWADIMDIEPLEDYLALSIPIVVGFGELDSSVPVESALALEAAFKSAGKENLHLWVYRGADHRLNAGEVAHRAAFFSTLSGYLR